MDRELGGLKPTGSQTDTTKRLTVHLVFFKNKNRSKENVIRWEYKLDTDGSFHTEMYFICIGSNRVRQKNRQLWLILACERANPGVNVNFFFFFLIIFIYFWLHWVFVAAWAFLWLPRVEAALQLQHASFSWPEKAMAPHSSTLAWKIPWTEEPGGLPSMGSHRVEHYGSDSAAAAAAASHGGGFSCYGA